MDDLPYEDDEEEVAPSSAAPDRKSLSREFSDVIAAGREAFSAEVAFQSARAGTAAKLAGKVAGWGVAAMFLLVFVLIALIVGVLLALAPIIGAWWATAAVAGVLLLAAGLAGLAAWAGVRRIAALFAEDEE
jgi:hypothetical protein